jgi:hypothetical protein
MWRPVQRHYPLALQIIANHGVCRPLQNVTITRFMRNSLRLRAALVVLLFAGLEVAAPLPAFHERDDELAARFGRFAAGAPAIHATSGRTGSTSRSCPACVICGLSAVLASGPIVGIPTSAADRVRTPAARFGFTLSNSHWRSRAPPSS